MWFTCRIFDDISGMSVANIVNDEYIPVNYVYTYGEHELNSEPGMKAEL